MTDQRTTAAIAVLGAGGHAKVVVAALEASGETIGGLFDDDATLWGRAVLGWPVSGSRSLASERGLRRAILAIGANEARRRVADSLDHDWVAVVHPRAWVHGTVRLGSGAAIMAGAIVQPASTIGRHAIVNTGASVDHDCRVGDFAHIAPGARLAGGVVVGEGALVGIGSSVIEGIEIGAGAIVGAGAAVIAPVPAGARVAGVPARTLDRLRRP
jgi:sugar O-acyltransferase (sialic acid O-acetyltransferase NeuD family)